MDIHSLLEQRLLKLPSGTNVFRLIDGYAEGFDDVFVDKLGSRWLISTRNESLPRPLLQFLKSTGEPVYHKRLDINQKEAPVLLFPSHTPELPSRFLIEENHVALWMDLDAGYSQGLFLDQRDNRALVRELVRPGDSILNTFSYTGAFSVYAALAGATTTTLDLAQPCLNWAKENMEANALDISEHFFCKGDTLHWLERFAKQGRRFQGIILDPPTFSRDKKGSLWSVEKDYGRLAALAYSCLDKEGWMLCTTNCRKLSLYDFQKQLKQALPPRTRLTSHPMPFDFTGEPYLKTLWVNLPV